MEPKVRRLLSAEVRAASTVAVDAGFELAGVYVVIEPAGGRGGNLREFLGLVRETPSVSVILSPRLHRVAQNQEEIAELLEVIEEEDRELHLFETGLVVDRENTWCIPGFPTAGLMPDYAALYQARERLKAKRC
jgi:DNA invertase Pin-like site-specific DNA recombinase